LGHRAGVECLRGRGQAGRGGGGRKTARGTEQVGAAATPLGGHGGLQGSCASMDDGAWAEWGGAGGMAAGPGPDRGRERP